MITTNVFAEMLQIAKGETSKEILHFQPYQGGYSFLTQNSVIWVVPTDEGYLVESTFSPFEKVVKFHPKKSRIKDVLFSFL